MLTGSYMESMDNILEGELMLFLHFDYVRVWKYYGFGQDGACRGLKIVLAYYWAVGWKLTAGYMRGFSEKGI